MISHYTSQRTMPALDAFSPLCAILNLARQEEIQNTLAYAHTQTNNNIVSNIENQELLDTTSIRRQ